MSKLQEFVGKIVQIIVSYNETQTLKNQSTEVFTNKSPEELHKYLQKIITDATSVYETRRSLLEYFLFVVDTIKPLTDQNKPLSKSEQQIIFDTLSSFMNTIKLLLKTSHSNFIPVKYNKSIIQMPGFVRGMLKGYSLCNTGQVISQELPESLSQTSFDESLKNLISEHQLPLLERERLDKAVSDGTTEKELMQEQFKNLADQNKLQLQEIEKLKTLNQELTNKLERVIADNELKEKQPRPEVEENRALRQKLTLLEINLCSAEETNQQLKKEINTLQDIKNPRVVNFYDNRNHNTLFKGLPDNSRPNITNNFDPQINGNSYSTTSHTQTE